MNKNQLFKLNEQFLGWSGFWPNQEKSTIQKIFQFWKMGFFLCVTMAWIVYPEFYFLYVHSDNVAKFSLGVTFVISVILCILKMGVFVLYRSELFELIKDMKEKWLKYSIDCKEFWDKTRIQNERNNNIVLMGFVIIWNSNSSMAFLGQFIATLIKSLFTGKTLTADMIQYPIPELFPFDTAGISLSGKLGIYFSATIALMFTVYIVAVIDASILTFLNTAAHFFELVSLKIDHLNTLNYLTVKEKRTWRQEIRNVMECHSTAISYVDHIEHIFNIIMIIQYFFSTFLLCMTAFTISLLLEDIKIFFDITIYSICMYMQIGTISFFGTKLMESSFEVSKSAWNCNWVDKSLDIRRTVLFIIMRSQKPVGISAAKFFFINLQTFARLLSTSASYFTILQNLLNN